jgi:hypothetical protein
MSHCNDHDKAGGPKGYRQDCPDIAPPLAQDLTKTYFKEVI